MATSNFCYENRCIVISDEDYNEGNLPETTAYRGGNRNYPASEVEADEYPAFGNHSPKYHDIVITAGYYEGACLDYITNGYTIEDDMMEDHGSAREVMDDIFCAAFGNLSMYRVRQLCGRLGNLSMYEYKRRAIDRVDEFLARQECAVCDAICNYIRDKYGFQEYRRAAWLSDGSPIYERVGA
jgi:hypothetical protein